MQIFSLSLSLSVCVVVVVVSFPNMSEQAADCTLCCLLLDACPVVPSQLDNSTMNTATPNTQLVTEHQVTLTHTRRCLSFSLSVSFFSVSLSLFLSFCNLFVCLCMSCACVTIAVCGHVVEANIAAGCLIFFKLNARKYLFASERSHAPIKYRSSKVASHS